MLISLLNCSIFPEKYHVDHSSQLIGPSLNASLRILPHPYSYTAFLKVRFITACLTPFNIHKVNLSVYHVLGTVLLLYYLYLIVFMQITFAQGQITDKSS